MGLTFSDGGTFFYLRPGAYEESEGAAKAMSTNNPFGDTKGPQKVFPGAPFKLKVNDYLVGIVTNERAELNSISFHTSAGRRSQGYHFTGVQPRGVERAYFAQEGNHITGLEVDAG